MKAKELYEDIRGYCRENSDEAVVKKYAKYFKEGYDATTEEAIRERQEIGISLVNLLADF